MQGRGKRLSKKMYLEGQKKSCSPLPTSMCCRQENLFQLVRSTLQQALASRAAEYTTIAVFH